MIARVGARICLVYVKLLRHKGQTRHPGCHQAWNHAHHNNECLLCVQKFSYMEQDDTIRISTRSHNAFCQFFAYLLRLYCISISMRSSIVTTVPSYTKARHSEVSSENRIPTFPTTLQDLGRRSHAIQLPTKITPVNPILEESSRNFAMRNFRKEEFPGELPGLRSPYTLSKHSVSLPPQSRDGNRPDTISWKASASCSIHKSTIHYHRRSESEPHSCFHKS